MAVYLLLGAILSTFMYISSRHPLPLGREICAHISITLFWPLVLFNIGRIFSRTWGNHEDIGRDEKASMSFQEQTHVFQVRVFYVEPTYAQARNIPVKEYSGTFYVRAANESIAAGLAIDEFNAKAAQRGVGWERRIVRCEACGIDSGEGVN